MAIKYKVLAEHYRRDPAGAAAQLQESFKAKDVRPTEFDLGRLFEEMFGWQEFNACRRKEQLANEVFQRFSETADGAVTTAAFQNISGQIVYTTVLDAYMAEEFVFSQLIPNTPTQFLDGEKIAGITEIGDEAAVRNETDPYTLAGVGEDWVFTPPLKDRGMIVPVTWEAIFADRTGKLLERAGDVGKWMGVNKEKRAIDCVIDGNTTAHRYNWRGTVIASYGDNSGTHTWDNLAATNGLTDWVNMDAALQVFNGLTDPYTGEPILMDPKQIIVTKSKERTAERILRATDIQVTTPGYATSGNPTKTSVANPYNGTVALTTSRLFGARVTAASGLATDWYLGDIGKYAKYMQAEPIAVVSAPPNNPDEFHRRIVQQYRVNERGAFVVVQPRAIVKSTA